MACGTLNVQTKLILGNIVALIIFHQYFMDTVTGLAFCAYPCHANVSILYWWYTVEPPLATT